VGGLTGLVGAGGGFLIVPVLVMRAGLDMRGAVGTSLLIIVLNTSSAFAGYVAHVEVEWSLALFISVASVTGALGGAFLSGLVSQKRLRLAFACLVLAMSAFIASQQVLPGWLGHPSRTEGHPDRTPVGTAEAAPSETAPEARG
jgi:uncharacterized membrane protein YfcA